MTPNSFPLGERDGTGVETECGDTRDTPSTGQERALPVKVWGAASVPGSAPDRAGAPWGGGCISLSQAHLAFTMFSDRPVFLNSTTALVHSVRDPGGVGRWGSPERKEVTRSREGEVGRF